jgi:signal transduction histidine kinase
VEVPLQEIVREARRLVAGQIAERGVRVEVTSEPIVLHGDRPRLVEVFQNLLDNAVKFLGDQPEPRIEIGAEQEGGEIVLFVRDNGKGIDPRHKSKLFGLFEKLDPGTPGSGIGLAMVRRIVEIHGGKIHAHSDGPGKGTTFRFTLDKTFLLPSPSKLCIL